MVKEILVSVHTDVFWSNLYHFIITSYRHFKLNLVFVDVPLINCSWSSNVTLRFLYWTNYSLVKRQSYFADFDYTSRIQLIFIFETIYIICKIIFLFFYEFFSPPPPLPSNMKLSIRTSITFFLFWNEWNVSSFFDNSCLVSLNVVFKHYQLSNFDRELFPVLSEVGYLVLSLWSAQSRQSFLCLWYDNNILSRSGYGKV